MAAARDNKIAAADLQGGTLTLSNIGTVGGTYCSPVVVAPESAIVALGKVRKLPRYNDADELVPMHYMNVSWSADHRTIDGVTIAEFSNLWKHYLENPAAMIADLR